MLPTTLLLIGPSGSGKTVFCKQFIYSGLLKGEPGIYLSTDESPEDVERSMKSYGFDVNKYKTNGTFRVIDCYSWKTGLASSSKYSVSNPADLAAVSSAVETARQDLTEMRLVLDSITGLTSICSHNFIFFSKFLQVIAAKIRLMSSYGVFVLAPEAHDQQFTSYMRQIFDGTLEMKEDDSGDNIKRLLRIFSLKGAKHKTSWTPFEITSKGIDIKSETDLRCMNCGRVIDWEPHVEIIDGKEYTFDSVECANTYKALKTFYGNNFE